jgi:hypothetical protein
MDWSKKMTPGGGSGGTGGTGDGLIKGGSGGKGEAIITYIGSAPLFQLTDGKKQELKTYVDSLIGCGCCTEFSPIDSDYLEKAMNGLLQILETPSNG